MTKPVKKAKLKVVKNCGGKKGKGSCGSWAGATTMLTKLKLVA